MVALELQVLNDALEVLRFCIREGTQPVVERFGATAIDYQMTRQIEQRPAGSLRGPSEDGYKRV
jgi:hypothetical protein